VKKVFFLGLISGVFAAISGIIFTAVYHFANEVDFSKIVNARSLIAINIGAGMLIAIAYWIFMYYFKIRKGIFFNVVLTVLTFASLILPFSITLQLDISSPELFPGLTAPMHFFPALAWFTLKPLFIKEE
jgi:hypothetical protein